MKFKARSLSRPGPPWMDQAARFLLRTSTLVERGRERDSYTCHPRARHRLQPRNAEIDRV